MRKYELKSNESIVYEGSGVDENLRKKVNIILTNLNLVLTGNGIRANSYDTKIIPVETIKEYNGDIQVKQNGLDTEIFFENGEQLISFPSKHDVRKFTDKIFEVYTGKKKSERGAAKVKNAIKLVDDTLGIDTLDTIKNVAEGGVVGAVFGTSFGGKKGKKKSKGENMINGIIGVAQGIAAQKRPEAGAALPEKTEAQTIDNRLDTLSKMKELLDSGIITQEDFDAKKKELLGL